MGVKGINNRPSHTVQNEPSPLEKSPSHVRRGSGNPGTPLSSTRPSAQGLSNSRTAAADPGTPVRRASIDKLSTLSHSSSSASRKSVETLATTPPKVGLMRKAQFSLMSRIKSTGALVLSGTKADYRHELKEKMETKYLAKKERKAADLAGSGVATNRPTRPTHPTASSTGMAADEKFALRPARTDVSFASTAHTYVDDPVASNEQAGTGALEEQRPAPPAYRPPTPSIKNTNFQGIAGRINDDPVIQGNVLNKEPKRSWIGRQMNKVSNLAAKPMTWDNIQLKENTTPAKVRDLFRKQPSTTNLVGTNADGKPVKLSIKYDSASIDAFLAHAPENERSLPDYLEYTLRTGTPVNVDYSVGVGKVGADAVVEDKADKRYGFGANVTAKLLADVVKDGDITHFKLPQGDAAFDRLVASSLAARTGGPAVPEDVVNSVLGLATFTAAVAGSPVLAKKIADAE